jgi:hypothetical protein
MNRVLAVSAVLVSMTLPIAACSSPPGDGAADAGPAGADGGSPDAGTPESRAFAVATDYATAGVASTLQLPSMELTQNVIAGVASTDPVVRKLDDVYVINRFGADNITVVDADQLSLISQFSTGAGSNPQDVALVGDTLYVAAFGTGGVLTVDRGNLDGGVTGTIDLSSLDPDGVPDCSSIVALGTDLYVACNLLDENFTPRGPGVIAVVDTTTDMLVDTITLDHANPIGYLATLGTRLVIATAPNFGDLTEGCVDVITTDGEPTVECLVENAALGGYAGALATDDQGVWLAVVEGFDPDDFGPIGSLRHFTVGVKNLPTGLGEAVNPASERPFDVARCPTGELVVSDAAGGVRVYGGDGVELSRSLLDLGLPPVAGGLSCY